MKNREEYQASIFAKRDALLTKRKKNITTAITGIAVITLLTVSVAALPSFKKEMTTGNTTVVYTSNPEIHMEYATQTNTDYDNLNVYDEEAFYETAEQVQKEEAVAEAIPEIQSERMTMLVNYPIKKDHPNHTFENTDYADESVEGVGDLSENSSANDNIIPESVSEAYFGGTLNKLIVTTAFNCLSEEQKSNCVSKENPDIIPVTSSSQSVYYVIFATTDKISYRVMLNQSDLSFVGTEILNEKEISAYREPVSWAEGYKGETQ